MPKATPTPAVLFALLIWVAVLRIPLTYSWYALDPAGFIERLCENKDMPELQCNGKCYLSQMLQAQKEAPREKPIPVLEWRELLLYPFLPSPWEACTLSVTDTRYPEYTCLYRYHRISRFFHPPPAGSPLS